MGMVNDMRLIDADPLIDDLEHDVAIDQDTLDYEELTENNRANIQFDKDCKQNAIDLLKNAPTIEPERKVGKWIKKHRHYGGFRSYTGFDSMGEQHTITVDERTEYDDFYCSECGMRAADISLNFCANCGNKKIKEGEDK